MRFLGFLDVTNFKVEREGRSITCIERVLRTRRASDTSKVRRAKAYRDNIFMDVIVVFEGEEFGVDKERRRRR